MANVREVKVPELGDFDQVAIAEVLVSIGEVVEVEQSLITLESDKASMEIPSPVAGVVQEIKVAVGDEIGPDAVIVVIEETATAETAAKDDSEEESAPAEPTPPASRSQPGATAAAAAPSAAATSEVEVPVPDIGDFDQVAVAEVLVAPGDRVEVEQSLITLESDKASMEIPSPVAGVVKKVNVAVGDEIGQDAVIAVIESQAREEKEEPAAATATATQQQEPQKKQQQEPLMQEPAAVPAPATAAAEIDEASFEKAHASPAVRRLARELGVDLGRVRGSGRKDRIVKEDVQTFVKSALTGSGDAAAPAAGIAGFTWPAAPDIDFARFGDIEVEPLHRIRKLSARNLHRNWLHIPHVTQHDEADVTELEAFRKAHSEEAKRQGIKLTPVAFLLKASAAALRAFPSFNASLDPSGENLVLKKYFHIGIAVDTDNGLVVPVIRDVDKKGLYEIARELGEISSRARDGKLSPSEFQGGCFSISSLGGIGGTAFTPIVNAPEVAILGVSRNQWKPQWRAERGEFEPRLMLPLSLSYDHRVIDGAAAARFIVHLSGLLGDLRKLLL